MEFSYSPVSGRIAISRDHVFVALESGKVICLDEQGQIDQDFKIVTARRNIKKIAAGFDYAVGLTSDGRIFTTGNASEFTMAHKVE